VTAQSQDVYEFGPFRLEPAELLRDGKPIRLEKRHIAVLRVLARNSQTLVTYDQFLKEAWGGRNIEWNNVSGCVSRLNKILGKLDASRKYIENVSGLGYRFIVPAPTVAARSASHLSVTIDGHLLKCLNGSRMQCIKQDVPFRTPNVMLALLDMDSGFTEKTFNAAKSGFGSSLRNKLRLFATGRQTYIDRKMGRRHDSSDWFEYEFMQLAAAEARREGCPILMEKH